MSSQVLSTPERHRHDEREADRLRQLQMTSPSIRRSRVYQRPVQPIPQPQFVNYEPPIPPPQPLFNVPPAPPPLQRRRNLRNPMVHPPALNAHHIALRTQDARRNLESDIDAQRRQNEQQTSEERMAAQVEKQRRLQEAHAQQLGELQRRHAELQQMQQRHMELEQQELEHHLRHQQEAAQCREAREQAREIREQQREEREHLSHLPKACLPYQEPATRHSVGAMDIECQHCKALHYKGEALSKSTRNIKYFGLCCLQGQISLPILAEPPFTLRNLLGGQSPYSAEFHHDIRGYNAALAFTSLGVKIDHSVTGTTGPYSFRIHGELCHRMGSLLPEDDNMERSYAQLYVHDPAEALNIRNRRNPSLNPTVMRELQGMLHDTNPYIPLYKQAFQVMREKPPEEQQNVSVRLHMTDSADGRRYNLPTVDEIAAIVPGNGEEDVKSDRDIILRLVGGSLKRISHINPAYDPLHYVLLFPRGEHGWHKLLPMRPGDRGQTRSNTISQTCYYAYRLHQRRNEASTILQGGRLFQQWIVDGWASTEQSKLNWIKANQKTLRADVYDGFRDAVANNDHVDLNQTGQRLILPSSHSGSPRHMYQLFQDSMAICRHFHKPDIFLTMTCNPKWPEIQSALLPGQKAEDRPDIVTRVFNMKKDALLKEVKSGIFGRYVASVHTIEFQKRGLPHMHLLIFLGPECKIRTPADVDRVTCAQIPDPELHPQLHKTVTTCMLHRCEEKKCLENGRCKKNYPKAFCEETQFKEDGYPEVARPDNGRTHTTTRGNAQTFTNRDVIPYNPYLSAKYDCHINVEVCVSVKAVKYIHKYIYKGHDRTTLEFTSQDEIKQYLDARYISACECCWRLFEFHMHCEDPNVIRLPVHLPDQQMFVYDPEENPEDVLNRAATKSTCLTAFFEANQKWPEIASQYTYQEFPHHFVWLTTDKSWKPRQ